MFNKVVCSYVFLFSVFVMAGVLGEGKDAARWVISFFIYGYFSHLVICYLFEKKMILPHGVLALEKNWSRRFIFVFSVIMMILFSL